MYDNREEENTQAIQRGAVKKMMKRAEEQLLSQIKNNSDESNINWLESSSDWGVVRNGGRRGAAHGAEAIGNNFFHLTDNSQKWKYFRYAVSDQKSESQNFDAAQADEFRLILKILKENPQHPTIHIGGGHDHAYPMGKAILENNPEKKLHIINIDAHLDTRTDPFFHSGTPFRQLLNEYAERIRLTQIGIHPFANPQSNYQNLDRKRLFFFEEMEKETFYWDKKQTEKWCQNNLCPKSDEIQFLNLDADALHSGVMEAVSAVNHSGLKMEFVQTLFHFYRNQNQSSKWFIGLYEMNPLFDNLSQKGARALSVLLYKTLYGK